MMMLFLALFVLSYFTIGSVMFGITVVIYPLEEYANQELWFLLLFLLAWPFLFFFLLARTVSWAVRKVYPK